GREGFKIYTTFAFAEDEKNKLKCLLEKFEVHFQGKENIAYERYEFFTYKQDPGQPTSNFITELKKRAGRCQLEKLQDSLIVTMIICGIKNNEIRERLLQEDGLTLEKAIELCQVIESSRARSEMMRVGAPSNVIEVEAVNKSGNRYQGGEKLKHQEVSQNIQNCNKCGQRLHRINNCPAFGKVCNFCKLPNHFATVCRKKKFQNREVNEINTVTKSPNVTSSCNDLFVDKVLEVNAGENNFTNITSSCTLNINKHKITFKIDSGAMANVLPMSIFETLGFSNRVIMKTNTKLQSYTGNNLNV
uniref:Uncharacterized protein LOC114348527 n=1 Tax=Diabrotica virgifera virgifera TaxID=50390 RepID=A0A6P7H8G7_DIAVI